MSETRERMWYLNTHPVTSAGVLSFLQRIRGEFVMQSSLLLCMCVLSAIGLLTSLRLKAELEECLEKLRAMVVRAQVEPFMALGRLEGCRSRHPAFRWIFGLLITFLFAINGGRIIRPGLDDILFLPERPYLPFGTLRAALLRPEQEHTVTDAQILATLQQLRTADLVSRAGGLDREQDWEDLLSLGERQLLAVARLLFANPPFAFLNRVDTALDSEQTALVSKLLWVSAAGWTTRATVSSTHAAADASTPRTCATTPI